MREAIREYIARETARQSFIAEARASYEHYKETGVHITLEEFGSWAESLSQKTNAMPLCHK
jgi:predicted transcriptional regulator